MDSLTAVAPSWSSLLDFHATCGPEVGDIARLAGFDPDPEQQLVLDQLFAFDRHGASVAFEVGVIAPRQNLKTAVCKMAALGWLFAEWIVKGKPSLLGMLSGAVAGLAASATVFGYKGAFEQGLGAGAGFISIAVALLAVVVVW